MLVSITPKTRMLRRYEGNKLTHQAMLDVPVSASALEAIMNFRRMPNNPSLYEGYQELDPPPPPTRVA